MQLQSEELTHVATEPLDVPTAESPNEGCPDSQAPECRIDLDDELTNGFAARLIRRKARRLVGRAGFTRSDRQDLEQDLKLALFERFGQFDPTVAHWYVFVTIVVENQIATILEQRLADKREHRHNVMSLSMLVRDADGELVELGEQIGNEHLERVTGAGRPNHEEAVDLECDLNVVLAKLPPDLRELCERLKRQPIVDVAREMDIPRTNLYRMLEWIQEYFEAEGFSR